MKYPKEYLDEIKNRLKVSTVVAKTVSLKKRGKEFVGLSPFKNEKTPSFTVNDEKEFYHCFATSEHGNIFDFVMKTQNLKFGEAVKYLAQLAGMQPYMFSKQDEQREKKWNEYKTIFSNYVDFYHNKLLKNEEYSIARDYLKNRSLSKDEVKKFKIGYIEKNPNFFKKLKKDYSEQTLLETGLFYLDDKKNIYVERFRGRLIFPINNISGQPIALGGRIIDNLDYLAKYINSPETNFFKKGSNLYNLDLARKLSNKIDHIYLVEGYMDVIGLSKNGINNVVANLGTSLTDKQILTLNQFFDDIIICFDGDESGYKPTILIGIMRGAAPMIEVLSRIFKLKCAYLAVESYSGKGVEDEQGDIVFSREMSSIAPNMGGKILLCDDLSDTGITFNKSIDWLKKYEPIKDKIEDIKTATLFKKKKSTFEPDFCAKKLAGNPWIVQPFEIYEELRIEEIKKKHQI